MLINIADNILNMGYLGNFSFLLPLGNGGLIL